MNTDKNRIFIKFSIVISYLIFMLGSSALGYSFLATKYIPVLEYRIEKLIENRVKTIEPITPTTKLEHDLKDHILRENQVLKHVFIGQGKLLIDATAIFSLVLGLVCLISYVLLLIHIRILKRIDKASLEAK